MLINQDALLDRRLPEQRGGQGCRGLHHVPALGEGPISSGCSCFKGLESEAGLDRRVGRAV